MKRTIMMKRIILPIAALLLTTSCQDSLEDKAEKEAKTYTRKNCPVALTDNITLDSMTFDRATHTFGYYYTMSGKLDSDQSEHFELMRSQLLSGLKNMTAARTYMDEGYAFRYVYRSQSEPGTVRFETLFTESDYK